MLRLPIASTNTPATWILLGMNISVYVLIFIGALFLSMAIDESFGLSRAVLLSFGWKENARILYYGEYWRFFTAMFLHGGLLHIGFNGFALYVLGPETERIYGTARFLGVYFVAGLAGGIASYAFTPSPSVGASGAIFGLIGALSVFFYTTRDVFGEFSRQQLQSMIVIIIINLLFGMGSGGVIDNYAHIGGLLGGVASGWFLVPRYSIDRRFMPPVLERHTAQANWASVAGIVVVLVVMTLFITPPIR